jgi:hypothetical protein
MILSLIPYLLIAAGLFSVICAVKEYPFFMEHRKARALIAVIGKPLAKVFYITLGVVLIVMGVVFLVTGLPPEGPS